jgi:predicted HD phosphohydrolase
MTATVPGPATRVDDVLALYDRWGDHRYDEDVAQLDHALQVAALAVRAGADDAVVAAALLHDVGHLLALGAAGPHGDAGVPDGGAGAVVPHEVTGPTYLAGLFPASVTDPIAGHVAAKRYLCAVDPGYHARLSAGSVRSLRRQGGPMSAGEAAAFADRPGRSGAVALRRWDDAGKVDGLAVPRLDEFAPLLHALARPAPGG